MRKSASIIVLVTIVFTLIVSAAQAATANRTWVSHSGLSSNTGASPPCNPQAPCDTFANALTVTSPGGEINCLDDGSYGPVNITQSVTIDCSGQLGGIDASGFSAITVNSSSAVVTLRHLTMNGDGGGTVGINIPNGAAVTIEHCVVRNFTGSGGAGIRAGSSSALQLNVSDTLIANNTDGTFNSGITVVAAGNGNIGFVLDRVRLEQNPSGGILAGGSTGTGGVSGFVRDSVVTGGNTGIAANTNATTTSVVVSVYRTHVVGNNVGILSQVNAAVILSNSTIQANNVALSSSGTAVNFSYGNNDINDNGALGTAPTVISQH